MLNNLSFFLSWSFYKGPAKNEFDIKSVPGGLLSCSWKQEGFNVCLWKFDMMFVCWFAIYYILFSPARLKVAFSRKKYTEIKIITNRKSNNAPKKSHNVHSLDWGSFSSTIYSKALWKSHILMVPNNNKAGTNILLGGMLFHSSREVMEKVHLHDLWRCMFFKSRGQERSYSFQYY